MVKHDVKSRERATEKARLDYKGDVSRVIDLLRGCVVCDDSIAEVRAAFAVLQRLEKDGVLQILQIKNRYVDGPTITGYLDANVRVLYKGNVAEVQIITESIYHLKNDQTPLYNMARVMGLVGPLPPEYALMSSAAGGQRPKLPCGTRWLLVTLRAFVGVAATGPAMFYLMFILLIEHIVPGSIDGAEVIYSIKVPTWLKAIYAPALASPFLIVGFLTTRDMVRISGWGDRSLAGAARSPFCATSGRRMGCRPGRGPQGHRQGPRLSRGPRRPGSRPG